MSLKRIILDCDGILADHNDALFKLIGSDLTSNDMCDFNLRKFIADRLGKRAAQRAMAIKSNVKFTLEQPVLPWAEELVALARELGEVMVLTAPWNCPGWTDARIKWLRDNLGFHADDVMVGRLKWWVKGDLFVDDKPSNIIQWANENPEGRGVLLAWSYNATHDPLPPNARRMRSDDLLKHMRNGFKDW